ncbi:MAG: hypothetical protein K6A96_01470 [Prevotella sp.]|nr:hypothetical protein [Prevotella sp.]
MTKKLPIRHHIPQKTSVNGRFWHLEHFAKTLLPVFSGANVVHLTRRKIRKILKVSLLRI